MQAFNRTITVDRVLRNLWERPGNSQANDSHHQSTTLTTKVDHFRLATEPPNNSGSQALMTKVITQPHLPASSVEKNYKLRWADIPKTAQTKIIRYLLLQGPKSNIKTIMKVSWTWLIALSDQTRELARPYTNKLEPSGYKLQRENIQGQDNTQYSTQQKDRTAIIKYIPAPDINKMPLQITFTDKNSQITYNTYPFSLSNTKDLLAHSLCNLDTMVRDINARQTRKTLLMRSLVEELNHGVSQAKLKKLYWMRMAQLTYKTLRKLTLSACKFYSVLLVYWSAMLMINLYKFALSPQCCLNREMNFFITDEPNGCAPKHYLINNGLGKYKTHFICSNTLDLQDMWQQNKIAKFINASLYQFIINTINITDIIISKRILFSSDALPSITSLIFVCFWLFRTIQKTFPGILLTLRLHLDMLLQKIQTFFNNINHTILKQANANVTEIGSNNKPKLSIHFRQCMATLSEWIYENTYEDAVKKYKRTEEELRNAEKYILQGEHEQAKAILAPLAQSESTSPEHQSRAQKLLLEISEQLLEISEQLKKSWNEALKIFNELTNNNQDQRNWKQAMNLLQKRDAQGCPEAENLLFKLYTQSNSHFDSALSYLRIGDTTTAHRLLIRALNTCNQNTQKKIETQLAFISCLNT